jgi:diadenosine tetraphosphate (Ap4A) HIT family hydrolase
MDSSIIIRLHLRPPARFGERENIMTENSTCPFCQIICGQHIDRIQHQSQLGVVIRDAFPVTAGHTLIIPKRHIPSFFDLADAERQDLLVLLDLARSELDREFAPAAFNIGINDGPAAGQTVPHLHIHLIPRYWEDGVDPRGGVRWVVPEKADYWSKK